jgi:hypothetical protein
MSWTKGDLRKEARRGFLPFLSTSALLKLWAALFAVALSIGCAPFAHQPSVAGDLQKYRDAKTLFEQGMYRESRDAYRSLYETYPQSQWAAEAQFNAAYILVYYKNPDRDYAGAQHELERYLQRYPLSTFAGEAQSWISLIKAFDQSRVRELLSEVESLTRKIEDTSKALLATQQAEAIILKERNRLIIEKNNLTNKIEELLNEKDALLDEKAGLLTDRERLITSNADIEQKNQELLGEKEELIKAKAKLEKSLREMTMVDVKMEKQRKKMKKAEAEKSGNAGTFKNLGGSGK